MPFTLPGLQTLILGPVAALAFFGGAALYLLAKEEINKNFKYLFYTGLAIFGLTYFWAVWTLNILYAIPLVAVAVISYFVIPKIANKLKGATYWQAFLLGAALSFAADLRVKQVVLLSVIAYSLVLSSALCRNTTAEQALKRAGKLYLNFVVAYLILIFFPFNVITSLHAFLAVYSLILPLIFYQLHKAQII